MAQLKDLIITGPTQAIGPVNVANSVTASSFVGDLSGNASTATKATKDIDGRVIADTYLTNLSFQGHESGVTVQPRVGNSSIVLSSQNFPNSSVQLSPADSSIIYITGTDLSEAGYRGEYFSTATTIDLANGIISATKFSGDLNGTADRALADGDGNIIKDVYVASITPEYNISNVQVKIQPKNNNIPFSTITIPYNDGMRARYDSFKLATYPAYYAYIDPNEISFSSSKPFILNGKIEVYPYNNVSCYGTVYFNLYHRAPDASGLVDPEEIQSNLYNVEELNYYDPYNLFPSSNSSKKISILRDYTTTSGQGILSIPRLTQYAGYKVEIYHPISTDASTSHVNLVSQFLAVPSSALKSAADGFYISDFSQQTTLLDRLANKTISGTMEKAEKDINGNIIGDFYLSNIVSAPADDNSGVNIQGIKGNSNISTDPVFIQTNQVFQSATTSSDNTNYSLLLAASDSTSSVTGTTNKNNSLTYNPSSSTLTTPNLSVSNSAYLSELTASTLSVNGQAYFANTPTVGDDSVQLATKRYYNISAVGSRSLYVKIKQPNENTKGQFNGNIKLYQYGNSLSSNIPPKVGDIPFDIYYNSDSNTYQNGYYYDQFNNVFSSMSLIVPSSFGQDEEPYVYLVVPYVQYGVYAVDCYKTFTTGNSGDNLVLDMSASTAPPNVAAGNYATFSLAKITAPIYNGQTI